MRVTNNMIANQVTLNLSHSIERFMRLQSMMSSGRRIGKPSDDPIGTQKDLGYRHILSEIGQYKKNIGQALSLLASYDNILGNVKNGLSAANELAVSLSNDTYDETARMAAANEADSLFNQLISLANSQLEGRYIFSGHRTGAQALEASASGVEYLGDFGNIQIEIETACKTGINLIGAEVFLQRFSILGEDSNWHPGINGLTRLSDLNLGSGIDLTPGTFMVTDNNLGINVIVDVSGCTTLDDVIMEINNQLNAGAITNLTASFGLEGNNLRWEAVANGLISGGTSLANLNSGLGVDLSEGKILISDAGGGINLEVDLLSLIHI